MTARNELDTSVPPARKYFTKRLSVTIDIVHQPGKDATNRNFFLQL